MESHSSIEGKGTTKVSMAAVTQRRYTGCRWRYNSDDAGTAHDMRKTSRMEWPEGCNQNRGKDGTNKPTTNHAVAPDQQRPKTAETPITRSPHPYGSRIAEAPLVPDAKRTETQP